MAINYSYYQMSFKGSLIPHTDFDRYVQKATALVDMITQGRASGSQLDEVSMAICAAAECCYQDDNGGVKSSERVGDYSVSYADNNTSHSKRLRKAVSPYLLGTGLMNRSC